MSLVYSATENSIDIYAEQKWLREVSGFLSSWDEIILVNASVAQRLTSHSMSYTHHAFTAKPLKV